MRIGILGLFAWLSLSLGGCSTLEFEPANHARLSSGKYIHMPMVSTDEDRLLREATEKAMAFHSQLRAFDVANNAIENRIHQLHNEGQQVGKGNRRSGAKSAKAANYTDVVQSARFDIRFSKGAVTLEKDVMSELSRALATGNFSHRSQAHELKPFVVLQVATHKKEGLDSFNARRLGAIHEIFKKNRVPTEAVKLKIVRITSDQANELKVDGNASRTIRLSSVHIRKLEL
jgi:hypothetical protein